MPNRLRTIDEYAAWVAGVVNVDPATRTREWASGWEALHRALSAVDGIYELAAIVVARWEFLGGLYQGNAKTDAGDALVYMKTFLEPVNIRYDGVAELVSVSNPVQGRLDFFTMLRNKPLHGLNPAAIATQDAKHVVTWWMGFSGIEASRHLLVDDEGGLHVDCGLLFAELQKSMARFALYLQADTHLVAGVLPTTRWKKAFWNRFCPKFMPEQSWTAKAAGVGLTL